MKNPFRKEAEGTPAAYKATNWGHAYAAWVEGHRKLLEAVSVGLVYLCLFSFPCGIVTCMVMSEANPRECRIRCHPENWETTGMTGEGCWCMPEGKKPYRPEDLK